MTRVLVTGSGERVASLAQELSTTDVEVLTAAGADALDTLDLGRPVDRYIQLPVTVRPLGESLVGRVRSFLTDGLLGRFALVERVLPSMAEGGTVVLVTGNSTEGAAVPDDEHSRLALLHLLAHATRAELAPRGVRVTVVGGTRSDRELAQFARTGSADPAARLIAEPHDELSAKDYQDWRTEVMGLVDYTG